MESVKAAFTFKLVTTQLKLYITQFVSCVAWKTYRQFTSTWVLEKLTLKQRIKSLDLKPDVIEIYCELLSFALKITGV